MNLASFDILKDGASQAVANSQTDQVVSNVFEVNAEGAKHLTFQITAASVSGTGAVCKIQQSLDGSNFSDVDATNAIVTLNANGRFILAMSVHNSDFATKMPLGRKIRFVVTTGGSDAATITRVLVQQPAQ
jgi:hypothetical protein